MHCMRIVSSLVKSFVTQSARTIVSTTLQGIPNTLPRMLPLPTLAKYTFPVSHCRSFCALRSKSRQGFLENMGSSSLMLTDNAINQIPPRRSAVQFSFLNGKKKTVKTVIKRFFRLHWGIWIRPRAGRHKKLWKKNAARRKRARFHVFCNSTQSYMLDKMVAKCWRKKTFYVDDPYESYHKRENFPTTHKL